MLWAFDEVPSRLMVVLSNNTFEDLRHKVGLKSELLVMEAEMQAEAVQWSIAASFGGIGGDAAESTAIPEQTTPKSAEQSLANLRRMAGGG